jgi:Flp pilus assembly pilin Flp
MSFLPRDEGQGLAEYALILVAVFAAVLAGLGLFGINIVGLFVDVVGAINGLMGS